MRFVAVFAVRVSLVEKYFVSILSFRDKPRADSEESAKFGNDTDVVDLFTKLPLYIKNIICETFNVSFLYLIELY
jgi:hypothetical protein